MANLVGGVECEDISGENRWPIIINASLEKHAITRLLINRQHKVRFSGSTVADSLIFPLSGIAFYLLPLRTTVTEWPPAEDLRLRQEIIENLDKLLQIHRHSYVVCTAPMHGREEHTVLSALQDRYIDSHLNLLISHNSQESVQCILTLAQALFKPFNASCKQQIEDMTRHYSGDAGIILNILALMGISEHDCMMLQDGLGGLDKIAQATKDQLMRCSLDSDTANRVINFFEK